MGLKDRIKGLAESAQAATSKVGIGADAGQIGLANQAQKLMNNGVDTPAQIDAIAPTGKSTPTGYTEQAITLTVQPASGEQYQATATQYVHPDKPYHEGEAVTVKVDPSDRNSVMIFGRD
jgi:hypothetical protein